VQGRKHSQARRQQLQDMELFFIVTGRRTSIPGPSGARC
jgi:hypothetical protein